MGINANALTASNPMLQKASFQGHTQGPANSQVNGDSAADPNADSQHGSSVDSTGQNSGNSAANTSAANTATDSSSTGSGQAADTAGGASGGQQNAASKAAPRNAQTAPARSRTKGQQTAAAASAGAQTNASAQSTSDDASTDFGSIMAIALGRSAASTPASASPNSTSTDASAAAPRAKSTDQSADTPVDPAAWLAQMMMPTPAPQPANGANTASSTDVASGNAISLTAGRRSAAAVVASGAAVAGPATASAAATANAANSSNPLSPQIAAPNGSPPVQLPFGPLSTSRTGADGTPLSPTQVAPPIDPTTVTNSSAMAANAATGNISVMADVQKLFSGLTSANTDSDADDATVSSSPATHAATASSGADGSQAAAALQVSSLAHTAAAVGSATLTIQSPVGSAAFADELSNRVAGLVQGGSGQAGITQAQLQLNPANLGPVQVHITMEQGQASVWFGATHSDTRAALEQSLPHLRQLFANAGMPLADSGVFREPPQQQQQAQSQSSFGGGTSPIGDTSPATVTQVSRVQLSLLDTYA